MNIDIAKSINDIINEVGARLPAENIADARELLQHDEWGESLSLIYTQLHEYDVKVSQTLFDQIKKLGSMMELDSKGWELLEVETLS